jgi:plastocyanin
MFQQSVFRDNPLKGFYVKRITFFTLFIFAFSMNMFAHTAFTLVSSTKKTIKEDDLAAIEKQQTVGTKGATDLTFTEKNISLVAVTGPEDDMLSYRIQGVRNPNLIVPEGATIRVLFVNTDEDMTHDIRFGHVMGDFPIQPDITETVGTEKLPPETEDGTAQANEIVIKANENGAYKYFCSVRGHAKGGMWGNILVGVKPGDDLKVAPKTTHVHSPDEDKKPDTDAPNTVKKPGTMSSMPGMIHDVGFTSPLTPMAMTSSINIGVGMNREGSGTSWLPESSPMFATMKMFGDGSTLMLHGVAFLRYTSIGSSRDASAAGDGSRNRFDAPTMLMATYTKPVGNRSQIGIRTMLSLDPLIERGYGYPLLYQSGEIYRDTPLHDRQHPHDFISELAGTYSYKVNEKSSFYFYAGLPGEPALGPVMYLHRPSGANNPDAPIGHHWQDSTHVSFGVLTAGYTYDKVKFEASAFNGTEPDQNRWAFDSPKLNSFSGRLSFNPTKEWAFQISYGYLKDPERSEPELRVLRRTTASAMYNKAFSNDKNWSNTVVWAQNHSDDGRSNSFLFESNYEFFKNNIFGRAEQVQKNAHDLALSAPHPENNFWVQSYSLGYVRDIVKDKGLDVGIGGVGTFNFNPSIISSFYGGTSHAGWQLLMRFRPSKTAH